MTDRRFIRRLLMALLCTPGVALSDPAAPLYFEQALETIDRSAVLEIVVESHHASGVPVSFRGKNLSDETLTITPTCGPIVLRDTAGTLYETDHNFRKKKMVWATLHIPAGQTARLCTWDGLTTFRTRDGLRRIPMPAGRYDFILRTRQLKRASGAAIQLGGNLGKRFEVTLPVSLTLGAKTTIGRDRSVVSPDGALILTNRGVGYAHLVGGGNLADVSLTAFHAHESREVRLMREGPEDPNASATVGPYRVELLGVDAYSSGSATVRVTQP